MRPRLLQLRGRVSGRLFELALKVDPNREMSLAVISRGIAALQYEAAQQQHLAALQEYQQHAARAARDN